MCCVQSISVVPENPSVEVEPTVTFLKPGLKYLKIASVTLSRKSNTHLVHFYRLDIDSSCKIKMKDVLCSVSRVLAWREQSVVGSNPT